MDEQGVLDMRVLFNIVLSRRRFLLRMSDIPCLREGLRLRRHGLADFLCNFKVFIACLDKGLKTRKRIWEAFALDSDIFYY